MARETQGSPASEKKLEQYGVWVKVKPREVLEAPAQEESFELSDLESPRSAAPGGESLEDSALTAEEEQLLDELDSELGTQEAGSSVAVPEEEPLLEDAELPEIDATGAEVGLGQSLEEELPELDEEPITPPKSSSRKAAPRETEIEVTLSEEGEKEDAFDDLAALETELASTTATARGAGASSSSEILSRIEEELRSIRTDLTQLRTELSGLRSKAADTARETDGKAESTGGFFDEDEDETIALTGDELDNILNTADITEESAEAATAEVEAPGLVDEPLAMVEEAPAVGAQEDILSYETPVLGEVDTLAPSVGAQDTEADDTLVLADDSLLPGGEEMGAAVEELPSELVLEELDMESETEKPAESESLEELGELELDGIPEIETPPAPASTESQDDLSDVTIDLETLDLGEEPKVIDAVADQVEDLDVLEEIDAPAKDSTAEEIQTDDVDLEALAAEAEALEGADAPLAHSDDLDIAELEALTEDTAATPSAEKEIEISFEAEAPAPSPDVDAELDQILDAEEVEAEAPVAPAAAKAAPGTKATEAPAAGGGVPDNLKEEIRAVLKYMDNLLEALPDEKIKEFASSDYFVMYKKLFEDLGLGE